MHVTLPITSHNALNVFDTPNTIHVQAIQLFPGFKYPVDTPIDVKTHHCCMPQGCAVSFLDPWPGS